MARIFQNYRRYAFIFAIGMLAVLAIPASVVCPKPLSDEADNTQWKCSRTAGILTICTRSAEAQHLSSVGVRG
jgi:hypothetical protein